MLSRELLAQKVFSNFHSREDLPGKSVTTDQKLDEIIKDDASSAYHFCGAARMGSDTDERSEVDTELKFIGIDQLRIVDASVIPVLPSANINACVFMIAEKAADLVPGKNH